MHSIFVISTLCQDSDSDWAPEVQGAANVEKSEEEALKVLLQPNFVKETAPEFLDERFFGRRKNGDMDRRKVFGSF